MSFLIKVIKMGQTCCNIDSKFDDVVRQQEYIACQDPPQVSLQTARFIEQDKPHVWQKKQENKYYCGEWSDGHAEGEACLFESDILIYRGSFVKGMASGVGTLSFKNRDEIYEGEFLDGKAHGAGKISNPKEGIYFEGNWFGSKPVSGTINFAETQSDVETIAIADFEDSKVVINFKDKTHYRGQVNIKLQPQGEGTLIYPSHSQMDSYQGHWQQGVFHGFGNFIWNDGSSYAGHYSYGKKQGEGKFIFTSKRFYDGHWLAGERNGRGTMFDKDGSILKQGIWQKGNFVMSLSDAEMKNQGNTV